MKTIVVMMPGQVSTAKAKAEKDNSEVVLLLFRTEAYPSNFWCWQLMRCLRLTLGISLR